MISVNCTSFRQGGDCLHQAAPRRWFGVARCIVWLQLATHAADPREPQGCRLCTPHVPPDLRPTPPASRVKRESQP